MWSRWSDKLEDLADSVMDSLKDGIENIADAGSLVVNTLRRREEPASPQLSPHDTVEQISGEKRDDNDSDNDSMEITEPVLEKSAYPELSPDKGKPASIVSTPRKKKFVTLGNEKKKEEEERDDNDL